MIRIPAGRVSTLLVLAILIVLGTGRVMFANFEEDQSFDIGPAIVTLNELENEYEPVPFDHLSHAKMAQMWDGCVTCHHYSPNPHHDEATTITIVGGPIQTDAVEFPACKSCHPIGGDESDIHMPGLKGAYHRQCLNCHKDWMHDNACSICHEPKSNGEREAHPPTAGDIIGRMHPPIPEPDIVVYRTRFTPADGANVTFRHKDHTHKFGIRCVDCHRGDNCANCHDATGKVNGSTPLKPGMTWDESHGPCMSCHVEDRCDGCHYKDDGAPPPSFIHEMTGQLLDEKHAGLACGQCHDGFRWSGTPTCGDASCHDGKVYEYPEYLPGPEATPDAAPEETVLTNAE